MPSPPLLTPPHSEEEWLDWFRLLRSRRVGVATFYRLMAEYGSARAALDALPGIAQAAGARDWCACPPEIAAAELARGRRAGAVPLAIGGPSYPAMLAGIDDAPPLLWCRGDPARLDRTAIALVGARNASSLGLRMARRLAGAMAGDGHAIVSGLARGIDAAAHDAALEAGGITVAVLAGGVDVVYPTENAALTARIAESGVLLSEQPMGLAPQARHFPRRNRIISGLARAVVVVEAAAKSGSLITSRDALDQGRDVLAVPGHPFDARASGANMLIRDGATLVRGADDLREALAPPAAPAARRRTRADPPPPPASAGPEGAALDRLILSRLGPSPTLEDELLRDIGVPPGRVAPALVALELSGRITRGAGGMLSRPSEPAAGDAAASTD
ncbi:DNA-processing protein DprA [Palleronia sediminis]|uniref:DNA-processing protein DprA n=1 Tax=Palleronia sediminis TaxID=2547833 RepID=UPI0030B7F6BF